MGPTRLGGLPAHPLLVHLVVTLVPLSALLVVLAAAWPAARRRLSAAPPVVALLALLTIPPTTHAGHALQRGLGFQNALIERHARLGNELLPWVGALVVVSAAAWFVQRRSGTSALVRSLASVVAVAVALGVTWMTYRIGDSGARAVWNGVGVAS